MQCLVADRDVNSGCATKTTGRCATLGSGFACYSDEEFDSGKVSENILVTFRLDRM